MCNVCFISVLCISTTLLLHVHICIWEYIWFWEKKEVVVTGGFARQYDWRLNGRELEFILLTVCIYGFFLPTFFPVYIYMYIYVCIYMYIYRNIYTYIRTGLWDGFVNGFFLYVRWNETCNSVDAVSSS